MTDQPTYRKALTAAKEAESQGMSVREIVVDGRKFRLIMGKPEPAGGYETRPLRRDFASKPTVVRHERRHIPAHIRQAVEKRDGQRCRYCGTSEGTMTLDHVHPWSRGGKHTEDNLVVACLTCNQSKYNRTLEEWKPDAPFLT